MRVNGVNITAETIRRTREHFAAIHRACIADAESGAQRVNDLASYRQFHLAAAAASLAGENDSSLTFMQRALWLQTGDCPAMLA